MPELPEVETIKRGLAEVLPGKRIKRLQLRLPKLQALIGPSEMKSVRGAGVTHVARRGKSLLIGLDTGVHLMIHLKMTGQLIFRENRKVRLAGGHPVPAIPGELPGTVTHAIFTFEDGSELFFNDLRQFGYIKVATDEDLPNVPILKTLGPEPRRRRR